MSGDRPTIAFVLALPYPEAPGGGERWVAETAVALGDRARVTVHYMVPFGGEGPAPIEEIEVKSHRCLVPPGRHGERFAVAPGLLGALSADVIHVHQYGSAAAQLTGMLGRAAGASTFVTDLGSGGMDVGSKLGLAHAFDGFLAISEFAASGSPADRTKVVFGGFDDRFGPGRKSERPEALYVGRLMPHKGVDWLIRSLPKGARLVIAGRPAGPRADEYLKMLRGMSAGLDVEFVLDAPDEKIAELYRRAWVVVLPSVERDVFGDRHRLPELFGLTPVEAMASGTPIVVSNATSLPELVDGVDVGAVVRQHDTAGMERELARLLDDRSRMERLGARAREVAVERYTWTAVADRCMQAYRALGRGRRSLPSGDGRLGVDP